MFNKMTKMTCQYLHTVVISAKVKFSVGTLYGVYYCVLEPIDIEYFPIFPPVMSCSSCPVFVLMGPVRPPPLSSLPGSVKVWLQASRRIPPSLTVSCHRETILCLALAWFKYSLHTRPAIVISRNCQDILVPGIMSNTYVLLVNMEHFHPTLL